MKTVGGDTVHWFFSFESRTPSLCLSSGIRAGWFPEACVCAAPFEVMLRWVLDVFLLSRSLSGV